MTVQPFSATAPVKALAGTAAEPSITFTGDTDTGLFSPAANQVAITTGGVQRLLIDESGNITSASPLRFPLGTASSPSISFTGDTNTGIYSPGADQVAVATNGTGRLFVDSSGRVGVNNSSPAYDLDVTGHIRFGNPNQFFTELNALSGTVGQSGAYIRSAVSVATNPTYSNADDQNTGIFFPAADTLAASTAGTERLCITSTGLVGIGTSSPSSLLHVSSTGFPAIGVFRALNVGVVGDAGQEIQIGALSGSTPTPGAAITGVLESSTTAGNLAFKTRSGGVLVERLRIDSAGRVGIGTTNPGAIFQTKVATNYNIAFNTDNDGVGRITCVNDAFNAASPLSVSGADLRLQISGQEKARLDSSGRLLVGTSTSTGAYYDAASDWQGRFQVARSDQNAVASFSIWNSTASTYTNYGGVQLHLSACRSGTVGSHTSGALSSGDTIGSITFDASDGTNFRNSARIEAVVDGGVSTNDVPGRLVFSVTADGSASPTERLRINNSGAIGLSGANFGTAGQVLVSNGSSAAPSWEQITPSAVFGWDHDNDTYGLYLPGTSIRTSALSGTVNISVQSRLRRCVINDSGVVQYYLDADDSTLKSGDWLRIVETQALNTAYTGTHSESTNSLLRVGVPAWAAGTFTRGQRVTHNGSLWECVAASTTATPAAGTVASDLSGTDGQVMVEVPAFSVRYGYLNGVHTREVRLGCSDSLIAQGFQPHPAFIKTDGTYKDAFYIGAYQVTGTSPATTVSGANNRVSMTRATQRSASAARGTGWHVLSYLELAAIQTLMVTEFRDMNTQRAIGNGAQEGSVYVVNTGLSNAAGNRSQNAYTSGGAVTDYISYRGLENIYGRAWQWVDGFNVYERVVYLSNDQAAFADDTSVGYEFYAQVPSGSASYQKELFSLPDVFLPSVVTGASATTYLGDAFWTSTGWRVALVGGSSADGARVGAFALNLGNGSGFANSDVSARLAYATN